ncbi:hypothetical protein AUEXF2481DRAFT_620697 [Aureobasidium subglaciale EXF-2481]|uniref:Uncharacterized protein n=1 Tax=Aureobasidium subglaciale (strain EXF-2481) TaxID=1043005 RepID=A0A074YLH4_AURSE|nr:uncharacterized protein AUEXF2481DRAFT_620697 [Aureobasidium subglaciale EXF-2481]KAI5198706.1 hypothetical protein E4T38_07391 [Aureobasidium subglaciale]KAI5217481.1 hypothetical protein E4T40_07402 [Aureobasidium subglaciale]KAI5221035.1 hypothetical protein E4T41_07243 [Aureobasidium subglaciale]KAI5258569.1 hypothetical protein E4T46_07220 [Aureobasidium subglaciale]KEQ96914.1 hypothetical protein AUEXF2481DRAFT_620697 [Aureobasidium subglaciale EXF-2481]
MLVPQEYGQLSKCTMISQSTAVVFGDLRLYNSLVVMGSCEGTGRVNTLRHSNRVNRSLLLLHQATRPPSPTCDLVQGDLVTPSRESKRVDFRLYYLDLGSVVGDASQVPVCMSVVRA